MQFTEPQECASCKAIHKVYSGPHYRLDGSGVLWVRCECGHDIPVHLSKILIGADETRDVLRQSGILKD